jgi:hypothetical protein
MELTETNLIIVSLICIFLIGLLSFNVYNSCSVDTNGDELDTWNTIKNSFGLYKSKIVSKVEDKIKNVQLTIPLEGDAPKKEVFNIDNNIFTYEQAQSVCKSYGAELATYDQVFDAYRNGANWCNYGWSANQTALYPIQKEFYDELQKSEKEKDSCGIPGVNGGFFSKDIKFGVNCYGHKPKPDMTKVSMEETQNIIGSIEKNKIDDILRNSSDFDVRPFNNELWSKYSYKKASYTIIPDATKDEINELKVEEEINEEDKDPLKYDDVL